MFGAVSWSTQMQSLMTYVGMTPANQFPNQSVEYRRLTGARCTEDRRWDMTHVRPLSASVSGVGSGPGYVLCPLHRTVLTEVLRQTPRPSQLPIAATGHPDSLKMPCAARANDARVHASLADQR